MKASQMYKRILMSVSLCFVVLLACEWGMAQVPTATVLGVVQDESGAVIAGAAVTVRNVETGVTRSLVTQADGRYRSALLSLGDYEVQVQLTGFETAVRTGITLTLGREAVIDFTLKVGAVTETVSVTGEAPLVETTTSTMSQLVDETSIALLPLNGRDLTQLAILQPGVTLATTSATSTTAGPGKKISMAGSRPNQSSYLLDGMDVMNNSGKGVSGVSGEFLGLDAVREFAVMTSNYTAEFSRSAGGVVNVVTKSGTNTLHGSVFEFLRNDNLDARRFFDAAKPEFKRNQFGGGLGGPIRKDKAFFFGAYEGYRQSIGDTQRPFVPTADARRGVLHNPERTITPIPAIAPVLALYPQPDPSGLLSTDGNFQQYIKAITTVTKENYLTSRVDYTLSGSDSLFVRYTFDNGDTHVPDALLPDVESTQKMRGQYVTLQESKIIGGTLINNARLGVNRSHWSGTTDGPYDALRYYPGLPLGTLNPGSGVATIGGNTSQPFDHPVTIIDYADDLYYTKGNHSMKFGFLGRKYLWGFQREFRTNGALTYTSYDNFLRNTAQSFTGIQPGSADTRRHWRQSQYGWYIQDDIRMTSRLTLNAGLRYEFITNPTEITGPRIAVILNDWAQTKPVNATIVKNVFKDNPSLKNFSPRLGFAWDVFGDGKTALRGGWAYLYDQIYPLYYENMRNPPLFLTVDIRPASYPNPFAGVITAPLSPVGMDYYNKHTPAVMQFNLAVQRELPGAAVINLAFIGSRSWHLTVANDVNTRQPDFLPNNTVFFPAGRPFLNPNWGRTSILEWTGQAFYSSMQVGFTKRLGQGVQMRANYVWSRNVDEGSSTIGGDFANATRQRQNPYDKKGDRGLASMHIGQVFNTSYVLDLPVGPGHMLGGNLSGVMAKIAEGWQLQGILTARSGPPLTATIGTVDQSRSGNQADRPDLKPGASNNPVLGGWEQYYDPNAFQLQTPGYFGNVGRNTIIGPGLLNVDFSIIKNTTVGEGISVQFRAESFNMINRANFGLPNQTALLSTGLPSPTAGVISDTAAARQIQFGLKVQF